MNNIVAYKYRIRKILSLIIVFSCYLFLLNMAKVSDVAAFSEKDMTLTVAIYPYVPNSDKFKEIILSAWKQKHPDVKLNFVDWDCYSSDPPSTLDVFIFDAIYLSYFQSKGFLEPL